MNTNSALLAELRARVEQIEGQRARVETTLPFCLAEIDAKLPGRGLAYGATHEIAGGGSDTVTGAVSALFVAGIAARTAGPIVWCLNRDDLFAPALQQVGLKPDRIIFVQSSDETSVMETYEEALRWRGLATVICELVRLPMKESRRFQLAAEQGGNLGLIIRRWRRQPEATDFGNPTASATRWRVSSAPSVALPVPGVGHARWFVELMRARGGECSDWVVEACDHQGFLRPSDANTFGDKWNSDVGIS